MSGLDTPENAEWRQKTREIAESVVRPLSQKYDEAQEYPWEIKDAPRRSRVDGMLDSEGIRRRRG